MKPIFVVNAPDIFLLPGLDNLIVPSPKITKPNMVSRSIHGASMDSMQAELASNLATVTTLYLNLCNLTMPWELYKAWEDVGRGIMLTYLRLVFSSRRPERTPFRPGSHLGINLRSLPAEIYFLCLRKETPATSVLRQSM